MKRWDNPRGLCPSRRRSQSSWPWDVQGGAGPSREPGDIHNGKGINDSKVWRWHLPTNFLFIIRFFIQKVSSRSVLVDCPLPRLATGKVHPRLPWNFWYAGVVSAQWMMGIKYDSCAKCRSQRERDQSTQYFWGHPENSTHKLRHVHTYSTYINTCMWMIVKYCECVCVPYMLYMLFLDVPNTAVLNNAKCFPC